MGIFKLKRGTEANRGSYTPAAGEIIATTDQKQLFLGDGSTAGGNAIAGGGIAAGAVIAVGVSSIPTGYLKCNGAAVSRTTYSALFVELGTLYGVGNGTTTFNLPDLRGEFIRGWADNRGVDTGRSIGSFQNEDYKSHRHTKDSYAAQVAGAFSGVFSVTANSSGTFTGFSGGTETRPRNVAMMYVIKY